MEPIITKHEGATYFDNDKTKVQYDRGGLSDEEYNQIVAEKNATIATLTTQLTQATTDLANVKYIVAVTGAHATAAFTVEEVDVTSNITNIPGIARNTEVTVTVTPDTNYNVTAVTVNDTAVELTEGAFTLTLDGNKNIVITTEAVETPSEEA